MADRVNRDNIYTKQWLELYGDQIKSRLEKRRHLESLGISPYKDGFSPNVCLGELRKKYEHYSKEELENLSQEERGGYSIVGRAMLVRSFGKAGFFTLDDSSDRFQLYVRKGDVSSEDFSEYKVAEYGDILYAKGFIFKTNRGELSLHAEEFHILTKSIRPLPEKFHGLTDHELRYRMRYVDMIMNPKVRETFETRSKIVRIMREFLYRADFLETETPMLHSVAGGAVARPFETHHNSLDMELSLRIAPELHLKRLIVGGYPRVFEINRCFRNEGLSVKHNPEFTTLEFYWAYKTYLDLMGFTEELLSLLVKEICGGESVVYGEREISFKRPFVQMTYREAIVKYSDLSMDDLSSKASMIAALLKKNTELNQKELNQQSLAKLQELCFEEFTEANLVQPTFVTEYPTEISPLARPNCKDPNYVDRFELFVNGWELANAFSELSDPSDQLHRFAQQALEKEQGNDEACDVDYDYVRALEYGIPPTAGEGIGIDRLCMILTNSPSIRDVILFPLLKREVLFNDS